VVCTEGKSLQIGAGGGFGIVGLPGRGSGGAVMSSFWDRQWKLGFQPRGKPSEHRERNDQARSRARVRSPEGSAGVNRRAATNSHVPAATRSGMNLWLSVRQAAQKLGVSTDTIERRRLEWQSEPVRFKVRFKLLVLDACGPAQRRYFEPDLDAFLFDPRALPRGSKPKLVPRFAQSPKGAQHQGPRQKRNN
jgi:hypothetical protein